jgi:hypothetical protein
MIMPYSRSLSGTFELTARKLVEPSVLAPPARHAFSLMNTWSSSLTLPAASSAETTYAVMTLVIDAGSTRSSAALSARICPVAKSMSTQLFALKAGGGGVGTLSAPGCGAFGVGRLGFAGVAAADALAAGGADCASWPCGVSCCCAAAGLRLACACWVAACPGAGARARQKVDNAAKDTTRKNVISGSVVSIGPRPGAGRTSIIHRHARRT